MNIFGKRLRAERKRKGLTIKDMAQKVGICQNSLSSYERGRNEPSMFILGILAETLGVSMDYLAGKDGKMYRIVIDVTTKNIQGVKECLAMQMEKYGDMRVVEVKEVPEGCEEAQRLTLIGRTL